MSFSVLGYYCNATWQQTDITTVISPTGFWATLMKPITTFVTLESGVTIFEQVSV